MSIAHSLVVSRVNSSHCRKIRCIAQKASIDSRMLLKIVAGNGSKLSAAAVAQSHRQKRQSRGAGRLVQ
jgi:hypothetical protein